MKAMGLERPNIAEAPAAPSTRSRREIWNIAVALTCRSVNCQRTGSSCLPSEASLPQWTCRHESGTLRHHVDLSLGHVQQTPSRGRGRGLAELECKATHWLSALPR